MNGSRSRQLRRIVGRLAFAKPGFVKGESGGIAHRPGSYRNVLRQVKRGYARRASWVMRLLGRAAAPRPRGSA